MLDGGPATAASPGVLERIQRSSVGPFLRDVVSRARTPRWRLVGSPPPAPPHIKQRTVCALVREFAPEVFVETGTYRGDTIAKVRPLVSKAISIELDPTLHALAVQRFIDDPDVVIHEGDSAVVLPDVLANLDRRALLWLDGHFSGGVTADAGEAPIMAEVDAALTQRVAHVVVVDDVRLFDGTDGYPTLDAVLDLVRFHRPGWTATVADDILRIHP